MAYDSLKQAPWLIDEEVEEKAYEIAEKKDTSPGEAFRQAFLKGANQI